MSDAAQRCLLWVDGAWRPGSGWAVTRNPYTGQPVSEVAQAGPEAVDAAVGRAAASVREMEAGWPAHRRAAVLHRAASLLEDRMERFARAITLEIGKPIRETRHEALRGVETLRAAADATRHLEGDIVPLDQAPGGEGRLGLWLRVPVGVVAAITPFNAPLNLICHKVGPAFAAGNATVLKPAPQAPWVAQLLVELLLEAGMPPGAVQLVHGGAEVGRALVRHPRVGFISFTGGAAAGREIAAAAGMRRALLELGGNAATIVHEDADWPRAAGACSRAGYANSGQSCISVQRLFVHRRIWEPFVEQLVEGVRRLQVGDPLDETTDIGTMVDSAAAERVTAWVEEALQGGARLLTGPWRREGAVVWPAVIADASPATRLVREELFGPVVAVFAYDDLEACFDLVNDSVYGLQAGIYTRSLEVALRAARRLKVGGVVVNGPSNFRLDPMPYGGVKQSGIGREGPLYAARAMTERRLIIL